MGKKLEGNGLWESSRMILPEHREVMADRLRNLDNKVRKELDEQQWQLIDMAIHQSLHQRQPLAIILYDPHEELKVIGLVDHIDQKAKQIKVDGEWFDMKDIVAIEEVSPL